MEEYGLGQPPVRDMRVSVQNEPGASALNIAGPSTAPDQPTAVDRPQRQATRKVSMVRKPTPKPAVDIEKMRLMEDLIKGLGHRSIIDLPTSVQQLIASIATPNQNMFELSVTTQTAVGGESSGVSTLPNPPFERKRDAAMQTIDNSDSETSTLQIDEEINTATDENTEKPAEKLETHSKEVLSEAQKLVQSSAITPVDEKMVTSKPNEGEAQQKAGNSAAPSESLEDEMTISQIEKELVNQSETVVGTVTQEMAKSSIELADTGAHSSTSTVSTVLKHKSTVEVGDLEGLGSWLEEDENAFGGSHEESVPPSAHGSDSDDCVMHFPSDAEREQMVAAAKKNVKKGPADPRVHRPADMPPLVAATGTIRRTPSRTEGLGYRPKAAPKRREY